MIVLVVVGLSLTSSRSSSQSGRTGMTLGSVTGTQDEWIGSVCKTGTFADGRGLPDATGKAMCLPKSGMGYILIGQYDSDFKMRNALAQVGTTYYVSGIEPDGTIVVFAVNQGAGSSILEPLTQFGFTINTAPTR